MDDQSELLSDEPVRAPRTRGEAEPDRPPPLRRRRHRAWWALLALLVLAPTLLWYADAGTRRDEGAAVAACETALRRASERADYRMGLTTNYVRVVAVGNSRRTYLADLMAPQARRVLPAVQRADRLCQTVHVEPWHFGLVARQHAATAYSAALVTLLQLVAAQGRGPLPEETRLQQLRDAVGLGG